jgi:hypothetical protein
MRQPRNSAAVPGCGRKARSWSLLLFMKTGRRTVPCRTGSQWGAAIRRAISGRERSGSSRP